MAGLPTTAAQHSPLYSLWDRLHSRRAARCRRWVLMEVSTLRGEAEHSALSSRLTSHSGNMWLLFSWATEIAMQYVMWHLNISKHTVIDWYNFVGDVCAIDVRNHPQPLVGFDNNGSPMLLKLTKATSTIGSITTAGLTSVNGFSVQWRESESPSSSSGYYPAPTSCRMGGRHTITWTNSTAASISTTL